MDLEKKKRRETGAKAGTGNSILGPVFWRGNVHFAKRINWGSGGRGGNR